VLARQGQAATRWPAASLDGACYGHGGFDANDALGLAQVVRMGWFREVAIKSMDAQTLRLLLMARA
jgi:hypothetical protein